MSRGDAVTVYRGHLPPLFDLRGIADAALPVISVLLFWAVSVRDEGAVATDAAALILTVLALLAAAQGLVGLVRLGQRLGVAARARRMTLRLEDERLVLDGPRGTVEVSRADILAIRERGHWGSRGGRRRYSDVYVITSPAAGRTHLTLPPVFADSPGQLAEALMRWRGPVPTKDDYAPPAPSRLASRVYDDATRGKEPEGGVVIRHGNGWLGRGPYVTALLGLALILRWLRFDPETASLIGPEVVLSIAAAAILVPIGWVVLSMREVRPRKGLALVITPAEVLIRTRSGVLRATFRNLDTPTIDERPAWSALFGLYTSRTLVIARKEQPPIRYEEAFLGAPAEVAAALMEAMKRGAQLRGSETAASSGPDSSPA